MPSVCDGESDIWIHLLFGLRYRHCRNGGQCCRQFEVGHLFELTKFTISHFLFDLQFDSPKRNFIFQ